MRERAFAKRQAARDERLRAERSPSLATRLRAWLRGGPVRRWVPKGYADRPVYTFETGGSTGVPKSRINIEDFRLAFDPDNYVHLAGSAKMTDPFPFQANGAVNFKNIGRLL